MNLRYITTYFSIGFNSGYFKIGYVRLNGGRLVGHQMELGWVYLIIRHKAPNRIRQLKQLDKGV